MDATQWKAIKNKKLLEHITSPEIMRNFLMKA
jgi:hypothetical protein